MKNKLTELIFYNTFTILLLIGFPLFAAAQTEISDWNDLNDIRNDLAGDYILMNDIDEDTNGFTNYNSGDGFAPIGSAAQPFTGSLDGNGFVVVGLFINREGGVIGLFADLNNAVISDLGLVDANVQATGNAVGILAGRTLGTTTITNVYSSGSVGTSGGFLLGGLTGQLNDQAAIVECWSSATVTGGATNNVGGLVGTQRLEAQILHSYAAGNVFSEGRHVGGLVGHNQLNATIVNSYAQGNATGDDNVGGLVGNSDGGAIQYTYSTGSVTGNSNVGGLIGNNPENVVVSSYWDMESSGQSEGIGGEASVLEGVTSLVTAEMIGEAAKDNMNEFDFDETWIVVEDSYPGLFWEVEGVSTSTEPLQEDDNFNPSQYQLSQNYPNPFNPKTMIRYELVEPVNVTLEVYSLLGKHVATLVDSRQSAGYHEVSFNADQLSSGVYIYRIQAGNYFDQRLMTLVK